MTEMIPERDIKPWSIKHGLYLDLEKYKIDGRSALGQTLARSRAALAALFPGGKPNALASTLINVVVYKSLKIELFQNCDLATGKATPTAMAHYLSMSNSLRSDITTLLAMTQQEPADDDLDLREYLATIKKAAQAQVIKGECEP